MMLKWLYIGFGTLTLIGGLITFWLPLPLGVPLIMIGTPIIMRHSVRGRRWMLRAFSRFPALKRLLRRRRRGAK